MNPLLYLKLGALVIGAVVVAGITHRVDNARYEKLVASYAQAQATALQAALDEQKRLDGIATAAAQREAASQAAMTAHVKRQLAEAKRHVVVQNLSRTCVPYGLVRVLDAAASGRLAERLSLPARKSDADCSTVGWADLAGSIIGNYGTSLANAEQLNALIRFYRDVRK